MECEEIIAHDERVREEWLESSAQEVRRLSILIEEFMARQHANGNDIDDVDEFCEQLPEGEPASTVVIFMELTGRLGRLRGKLWSEIVAENAGAGARLPD
jgi:hypothetical protein